MTTPYLFIIALRWIARILGTLVVLLVGVITVGEGVPNPLHQPVAVNLCLLALLTILAGQIVAWWREGLGGALVLAGLTGFAIVNHGLKLNAVFASMLLTGLLYLICSLARHQSEKNRL